MKFFLPRLQVLMAQKLLARPSERPINQASLGLLVGILVMVAFCLLLFSFFQWRIFDNLHKSALQREERLLINSGLTQEMSTLLCNAHRATLSTLLASEKDELRNAISDRSFFLNQYAERQNKYRAEVPFSTPDNYLEGLTTSRDIYVQASAQLVEMVVQGDKRGALAFRIATVRPAFDLWQKEQDALVKNHLLSSRKEQQRFTVQAQMALNTYLVALLFPLGLMIFSIVGLVIFLGLSLRGQTPKDPWFRA